MKRKLLAVIASTFAFGIGAGEALAQSAGQAQEVGQQASTSQSADSDANANQNAVNANVPVSIAGGDIVGGTSAANQAASNAAKASSSNSSGTLQAAKAVQNGGGSSCTAGCGGSGQAQAVNQQAETDQKAEADADAKQNAVNANVPVNIAGDDVTTGSSSANQIAVNKADADAKNKAATVQLASAEQTGGSSSCKYGCGGSGQYQEIGQAASTEQDADADADADQNAVNANVPVNIAGDDITTGDSSANQIAVNEADADAENEALTGQLASATQTGGGSSCYAGCGGSGQYQAIYQDAKTKQDADADADAKQNAVNANVPVNIAGDDITTGSSSANQIAVNEADADAENKAATLQAAKADQSLGSASCKDTCDKYDKCEKGCGGSGQAQKIGQWAETKQDADADADAKQNAVNSNAPVSIAGDDITSGDSSANQLAVNDADAEAENKAFTGQLAVAKQTGGSSSCKAGCGGAGQFQAVFQAAETKQDADADADADQNAVNANAPVSTAGDDITSGDSSANQLAVNEADADAENKAFTGQLALAKQTGGGSSCHSGCGGAGQFQAVFQGAETHQDADADADADQNAVNANAPVSTAGDDITSGDSSANQLAVNEADADAENEAATLQAAVALQSAWSCKDKCDKYDKCEKGCGGSGQAQKVFQWADTDQDADADADADQNAVNANAPVSTAGDDITGGSSSANQYAENEAEAEAENGAFTLQLALLFQSL